jgi:hypothetical protein
LIILDWVEQVLGTTLEQSPTECHALVAGVDVLAEGSNPPGLRYERTAACTPTAPTNASAPRATVADHA